MNKDKSPQVRWMELALSEAKMALGRTFPNPMVGCVLVHEDKVLATGFHALAGTDHAEKVAIKKALSKIEKLPEGTELYVTLEPCCHHGRTPPCTDFILQFPAIKKVIVAMEDPNPLVAGKGIEQLRRNNVVVEVGLLAPEAAELNRVFLKNQIKKQPYVSLKLAATLDGKVADQYFTSKWITGEIARSKVHELRDIVDGLLVGIGTILKDDPSLNTRLNQTERAQKIFILDKNLEFPLTAKVIEVNSPQNIWLITRPNQELLEHHKLGLNIIQTDDFAWESLLALIFQAGVHHLLVEGGSRVASSLVESNHVDRLYYFLSPKILGSHFPHLDAFKALSIAHLADAKQLKLKNVIRCGEDILIEYDFYKHD